VICRPGKPRAAGESPDGAALIRSAIVSPGIDAVERRSEQNPAMAGFFVCGFVTPANRAPPGKYLMALRFSGLQGR